MTTFMKDPPDLPYSAGSVPICSLNSATDSIDGTQGDNPVPWFTSTVFGTPSTATSLVATGEPLAGNIMLVDQSFGRPSPPMRFVVIPVARLNIRRLLCPFMGRLSMIFVP